MSAMSSPTVPYWAPLGERLGKIERGWERLGWVGRVWDGIGGVMRAWEM